MNISEQIFDYISKYTNLMFGNPGTTELPFLKYKPNSIKYYLALHDGIAVGMSAGSYLYNNKIGIVNLHAAPGLMNSIGYIYSAKLDRTPLLVIVGQQESTKLLDEPVLTVDLRKIPYVKEVIDVKNKKEAIKAISVGIRTALSNPSGPVIVSLPFDIAEEECEKTNITESIYTEEKLVLKPDILDQIAEEINNSKSIAIVAGYEIDLFDAHDELIEFSEKIGSPIFAEPYFSRSPSVKIDAILPRKASQINKILMRYDLVLLIGSTLHNVIFMDEDYMWENIIQITTDHEENVKRFWKSFLCDPKYFLKEILLRVKEKKNNKKIPFTKNEVNKNVSQITEYLKKLLKDEAVFEETPAYRETIMEILGNRKKLFFSNRSGFLGWALPASIGYAIAGGKSLTIIGDGSFHYSPQALWTASNYDIELKILVLNNKGYESLRSKANYQADYLSPITSPHKVAQAYGFEVVETTNWKSEIKWLMENDKKRKFLEIIIPE
ncbi:Benzoylformate decarboxylase [bacterium HR19]|nr:Benzoylformate decarboxylase [bacterium HR19]